MHSFRILIASLLSFACLRSEAQLEGLSDEFDDSSTIANWQAIDIVEGWNANQLETFNINSSAPGKMRLMPYSCSWYGDYRGPLIFKNIDSRNFAFTIELSVTNRAGNGLPTSLFSLAGCMMRTPRQFPNGALNDWTSGGENYVFLACGTAQNPSPFNPSSSPPPHFEVKTTVDGTSTLEISGITTLANVTIRLVRIDNIVVALYRLPGQPWKVHKKYNRPDFGDAVQVGLVTYTDWPLISTIDPFVQNSTVITQQNYPSSNPDLVADFDYARFGEVTVPSSLQGVDLFHAVTNDELLSFLGTALDKNVTTLASEGIEHFTVFPNPAASKIQFAPQRWSTAIVLDLAGKCLIRNEASAGILDISKLSSGVYILKLLEGTEQRLARFVKE